MQANTEISKLPQSGSGYKWKFSKKKANKSSERKLNTSAPDDLNLVPEAQYRNLSPHLKSVDIKKSGLDKEFFMKKI